MSGQCAQNDNSMDVQLYKYFKTLFIVGIGVHISEHGSLMVSTSACHAGGRRFDSRTRHMTSLGVKTWLSTLEIVNLCVFRMRH